MKYWYTLFYKGFLREGNDLKKYLEFNLWLILIKEFLIKKKYLLLQS